MDPRHPPVPSPATHSSGRSLPAETDTESEYAEKYNEKSTYARKDSTRTDCASKASYSRPHDSVISPFSPKASAPPSPSSSISSEAGRKQRSLSEIQETHARQSRNSHRVSYPPRAHLDPEKANLDDAYAQNRGSVLGAGAVVYDKSEYHEKGPEDKAWQLLVCGVHCTNTISVKA